MYEVEETCDRVLFLSRGRILLEGDPRTLPHAHGAASLEELFIRLAREPLATEPLALQPTGSAMRPGRHHEAAPDRAPLRCASSI